MRGGLLACALALVWNGGAGCSRNEAELDRIFEARTPRPEGSDTPPRRPRRHLPGETPFGLPARGLAARVGDFVLVPSRAALERAFEEGVEEQTFVFYGATILELGPVETRVRYLTHEQRTLPNTLVVPIRRGELASRGDLVLTSHTRGAGLVRALTTGGEPGAPRVSYLDPVVHADEPASFEDVLPRDTFHVIREPGEPGSTVACGDGREREALIVLKAFDEHRLGLGFAGRLRVVRADSCRALPIRAAPSGGQTVWFPQLSGFISGRVERFDPQTGRAWVTHEFAGESRKFAVGLASLWFGPEAL
jgi:hypothetical protein